ncbi:PLC-like phosphodiesterase [Macrolepiota fuliginosa MF-IS2]|uniref:PLC-like phosphodiesterase n=1 Tax=Macrolepiota fuliginosa MF-IS2 TaxID=1400762 RepID=A0A9P5XER6_9AGAR|nr:PLC-like phosphodiesterase [Macrolepiota fuliginosa MF-IS2]
MASESTAVESAVRILPDCWGHRGASARFPENTLASFEAAIRDGAEGIESDVHTSKDNVVLMFHDPDLRRTTNSTGWIKERNWFGEDGMQHVRTIKEPQQPIPTFAETIELLMKPENRHVKFNVDVKIWNDPEKLFNLLHEIISSQPSWEMILAPRILLGLWHPKFVRAAKKILPYCRRSYLGVSPYLARKYFWDDCDAFSVAFAALTSAEGERFREECKKAGKYLMVWTVNDPARMVEVRCISAYR